MYAFNKESINIFNVPLNVYTREEVNKKLNINKISFGVDELLPLIFKHCADELTLTFYFFIIIQRTLFVKTHQLHWRPIIISLTTRTHGHEHTTGFDESLR